MTDTTWADYSEYTLEAADERRSEFTVSIDGTDLEAFALAAEDGALAVDVSPTFYSPFDLPADRPVTLETPEETARARLAGVSFDLRRIIFRFDRVGEA